MSCTWKSSKTDLLRDFNLKVKVHKPRVSYRESIRGEKTVTGSCNRTTGAEGQEIFGKVTLKMEPDAKVESGVKVLNRLPPDSMPPEFVQTVKDQIQARGQSGGCIGGFPSGQNSRNVDRSRSQ